MLCRPALPGIRSSRLILAGKNYAFVRCLDVPLGGHLSLGEGQQHRGLGTVGTAACPLAGRHALTAMAHRNHDPVANR